MKEYYDETNAEVKLFEPEKDYVKNGNRFFDEKDVDASWEFWLTAGLGAHKFEHRFAEWLGVKYFRS